MPLSWTISREKKLVHATAVGEVTSDELYSYMRDIIAQGAMPFGKIFDMREATAPAGAERLREVGTTVLLYGEMKLGKVGPLAIVAASDKAATHAKAFFDAASANRPAELFFTIEDAKAWLGHWPQS